LFLLIALQKRIPEKFKIGGKVPPEEYVEGLGPCHPSGSRYIFFHIKASKVGMLYWTWWLLTLARHGKLYRALHPKL